jgi:hypothetical protein
MSAARARKSFISASRGVDACPEAALPSDVSIGLVPYGTPPPLTTESPTTLGVVTLEEVFLHWGVSNPINTKPT